MRRIDEVYRSSAAELVSIFSAAAGFFAVGFATRSPAEAIAAGLFCCAIGGTVTEAVIDRINARPEAPAAGQG